MTVIALISVSPVLGRNPCTSVRMERLRIERNFCVNRMNRKARFFSCLRGCLWLLPERYSVNRLKRKAIAQNVKLSDPADGGRSHVSSYARRPKVARAGEDFHRRRPSAELSVNPMVGKSA